MISLFLPRVGLAQFKVFVPFFLTVLHRGRCREREREREREIISDGKGRGAI